MDTMITGQSKKWLNFWKAFLRLNALFLYFYFNYLLVLQCTLIELLPFRKNTDPVIYNLERCNKQHAVLQYRHEGNTQPHTDPVIFNLESWICVDQRDGALQKKVIKCMKFVMAII